MTDPVETELAQIKTMMRDDPQRYYADNANRDRYVELLEARGAAPSAPSQSALDAEIAFIEAKMGTPEYFRDEGMQARIRELYDARERGITPAPMQRDEIADIQRMMREDPQRYYRDEAIQARYRELLEARVQPDVGPDGGAGQVEIPSAAEWMKAGGSSADYGQRLDIARDANDILTGIPERERIAFGSSFNALPQSVQGAAFVVLGDRSTVSPYPMSPDSVARLRREPAYAGLIAEWGQEAPQRLARAQERLFRILDRLGEREAQWAAQWFDKLPPASMAALTRQMAR